VYTALIPTMTSGVHASATPRFSARSTRKASLKRASVSVAPTAVTRQNALPIPRAARHENGAAGAAPALRSGSRTANAMSRKERAPGITAIQNTARKSFDHASMSAIARSGPASAPTVSSDWRSP